jgi:hypothetical protein
MAAVDEKRGPQLYRPRPDPTWPRLDPVTQRLICRNCWNTYHGGCKAGANPRPTVCQCAHHEQLPGPINWTARYLTTMHDLVWLASGDPDPKATKADKAEEDRFNKDLLEWIVMAFKLAYVWEGCDNQEKYDAWVRDLRELFFDENYMPGRPGNEKGPRAFEELGNGDLGRPN